MDWDAADFAVFGVLLGGVVLGYALAVRRTAAPLYRRAVLVALVTAFLLVWLNGAVGIIGSESEDANLMFFGVLAVAAAGAVVARFRPAGMARAMLAAALAQVLVAGVALVAGFGSGDPHWPLDILALTGIFAGLWLLSAALFRRAARPPR